jgi:hypothetical protein
MTSGKRLVRHLLLRTCTIVVVFAGSGVPVANSAPPSKDECVESFSRAQDSRERGQLSEAKRLFLHCAQSSCPTLLQSDCAKYGDDLDRTVPSLSFSARSGSGEDIADAQVFVDGVPLASRIDDGKAHDVNPGKHSVRFVRGKEEASVNIIVAVGEKNRNVSVVLTGVVETEGKPQILNQREVPTHSASRSVAPLVIAGIGGVAVAAGAIVASVGLSRIPTVCTTSPRECAAPPGDPAFGEAKSAIDFANMGVGVAIGGAALSALAIIWYISLSPSERVTWLPAKSGLRLRGRGDGGATFQLTF